MPTYQVLYARQPTFHASGEFGTPRLEVTNLQSTHVRLCQVEAENLDDAWRQMQGENWSPNGEARPLLERVGLSHTSMSVGDVIQDDEGTYWECLDTSTTLPGLTGRTGSVGLGWRPIKDDVQGDDCHGQA